MTKSDRLVWCWWERDEPENGLLGFHTRKDRDRFSTGKPGPFRRRLSPEGRTVSQLATWADFINSACAALNASKKETGE